MAYLCTNQISCDMRQILVTIDENQPLQNLCNAIGMLRGVLSTSIFETGVTKQQRQEAYVKESLSRALQEVRLAELEGRDLQSFDQFMAELDKEIS